MLKEPMMPTTFNKSLAFALGFSFAFLPSYGPFMGLLFLFADRWPLRRMDLLWGVAALLMALPLALHGGAQGMLFGMAQILAPWLIYKTFARLPGERLSRSSSLLGYGLLSGLAAVVLLGLLQIEALAFDRAKTIAQAIVWEANPALYGHTVLALGVLLAVLLPRPRLRIAALGLSALGILVSGSREAAIAWLLVAAVLIVVGARRSLRARLAEAGLVAVVLALTAGLGPLLGWGRVGFLLDLVPAPGGATNLVQGSEIARGDWWDPMGVTVESGSITLGGVELTSYTVHKTAPEGWRRLQQAIPIAAGTPYTLSAWVRVPQGESRPGFQAWGQPAGGQAPFSLGSVLAGGQWQASASGPGHLVGSGVLQAEGDWRRVWTSFVYTGEAPTLTLWVGLAPDQRQGLGEASSFAGFQLEEGQAASPYTPGSATKGLTLGVARLPYWRAAWAGFLERPLWGWGQGGSGQGRFPAYVQRHWPGQGRLHDTPSHAHNLFLQILFERGLVGLAGLGLLLALLSWVALRERDAAFLVALAALLLANLFDTTLLYGGVIYPLAAVAGWRAGSYRAESREGEGTLRQLGVRLGLAAVDFVVAALALLVAALLRRGLGALLDLPAAPPALELLATVGYALLLWPAMAWREGLYPGYGLTAPQELKKQVMGAAYAGLILAAGTVFFYQELPIPRSVLLMTVLLSMGLGPLGRALAKRLLLRLGWWGRRVVILGAGEAGRRVARALSRRPLDGLRPVAFFDDASDKRGRQLEGLQVCGALSEADTYASQHGIRHAIVAVDTSSNARLADLVNHQGRAFKHVQFVPELGALPSQGVYAGDLDGMLALEVRRGLYSKSNQSFKRFIDLLGGVLGTLFISPLLLALYLWVRLDSRGPAFYRSARVGQRGETFYCLKFRSMYLDADERLQDMLAADAGVRAEYERYHKLEHDPRITRAGRILRRYSLDELPQLYNVMRGDMSLVGPRPYMTRELGDMGAFGDAILEAKPGVTGYWQVSGRNEVTFEDRLEMEAHYVRNWSIWWDIVILAQTAFVVARQRGAH